VAEVADQDQEAQLDQGEEHDRPHDLQRHSVDSLLVQLDPELPHVQVLDVLDTDRVVAVAAETVVD